MTRDSIYYSGFSLPLISEPKICTLSDLPVPKILSFPGYCRCCAMRRRLGDHLTDYVSHPLFAALGGVHPHFRVLFCRDTVQDRELYKLWKCQNYYRGGCIEFKLSGWRHHWKISEIRPRSCIKVFLPKHYWSPNVMLNFLQYCNIDRTVLRNPTITD